MALKDGARLNRNQMERVIVDMDGVIAILWGHDPWYKQKYGLM
jgi:hypothetical protein